MGELSPACIRSRAFTRPHPGDQNHEQKTDCMIEQIDDNLRLFGELFNQEVNGDVRFLGLGITEKRKNKNQHQKFGYFKGPQDG